VITVVPVPEHGYRSFSSYTREVLLLLQRNDGTGDRSITLLGIKTPTAVVFQFATSIVFITATVIIYRQMDYILNKNLGFDKDQIVLVQGIGRLENERKAFTRLYPHAGDEDRRRKVLFREDVDCRADD
jgi:hypothetical protein